MYYLPSLTCENYACKTFNSNQDCTRIDTTTGSVTVKPKIERVLKHLPGKN